MNFLVYEPALWDVKMPGLHESTELANVLADEPVLLDLLRMCRVLVIGLIRRRIAYPDVSKQDLVKVFRDAVFNALRVDRLHLLVRRPESFLVLCLEGLHQFLDKLALLLPALLLQVVSRHFLVHKARVA